MDARALGHLKAATRRALVALALFAALVAAACTPRAPVRPMPAPATRDPSGAPTPVYVVRHGWHVGLAVAREAVAERTWPEIADMAPARYVEVGWGDGAYYPASRGTTALALKAAFRSTSSVLHVVGFDPPPEQFFAGEPMVRVDVSRAGFEALCRYIHAHYARSAGGRTIIVAPGVYGRGYFYLARGRYSLLHNSNHWAAVALREAGCPIDASDALTAGAVLRQAAAATCQ